MEQIELKGALSGSPTLSESPSNVISKIVRELPVSYRKNFALTCKDFYKIVCHEDRFKHKINIEIVEMLYDVWDSIVASERIFDKLEVNQTPLDSQGMDLLVRMAEKHGSTIKKLKLMFFYEGNPRVEVSKFQEFLNKFPNVLKLRFHFNEPVEFLGEPKSVLQSVKILKLSGWLNGSLINNLMQFIEPNALESFVCNGNVNGNMENIFERQHNLKKIDIRHFESSAEIKHLHLENIGCFYDRNNQFDQIVRDHTDTLKKIKAGIVESHTLLSICNQCTNLDCLSLFVIEENFTDLLQISRLKKLSELELSFNGFKLTSLNDLAEMEMMSMIKLEFWRIDSDEETWTQNEILDKISKNWPNIEDLTLDFWTLPLNEVIFKFKKLKSVQFSRGKFEFMYDGHVHPGIEKLDVNGWDSDTVDFPPRILQALPNIKSLEVKHCYFLGAAQLKALNGLEKLKQLKIGFKVVSANFMLHVDDIEELKKLLHRLEICEIECSKSL